MATGGKFWDSQNNTGVKVTKTNIRDVIAAARVVLDAEVLVGVPSDTTERDPALAMNDSTSITNAALAYIHDNGAPEVGIPARPFMRPGIEEAMPEVENRMGMAMRAAMRGNVLVAEQAMHQVGLVAQSAIRRKIDDGIPPPLSEYTLKKRAERGRRGAMQELDNRAAGMPPSMDLAKPLVDTGEMRKSIKYVIRSRKKRK